MDTIHESNIQININEINTNSNVNISNIISLANIDIENVITTLSNVDIGNINIGNVDIGNVITTIENIKTGNIQIQVGNIDVQVGNVTVDVSKEFNLNKILSTFVISNDYSIMPMSFKITDNVLSLIKVLLKDSPKSVEKISNTISDIISDGILDAYDIPKIVLLITELHNTHLKDVFINQNIKINDLFDLIKFIIHLIVERKYVKVENQDKIFKMLDMSLTLLNTTITLPNVMVIKPGSWCGC